MMKAYRFLFMAGVLLALVFTLSCSGDDGRDGKDGESGAPGSVVSIGSDGYWYIDGVKTNVKAAGTPGGEPGKDGDDGRAGEDGKDGQDGQGCDVEVENFYFVIKCGGIEKARWAKALCGKIAYDPETFTCESNKLSEFTDKRDGKTYKIAVIGAQVWMIEDLSYGIGKYDWETANSVCPTGWHLPSSAEWGELEDDTDFINPSAANLDRWWSSTEIDSNEANTIRISDMTTRENDKASSLFVRCIMD